MTTIILIRHGQTDWNLEQRFRGRAPVPLNARGRQEAELTAHRVVSEWNVGAIYTSPLPRAVQTAEPLVRLTGLTVRHSEPFADLDYGAWEGLTLSEVAVAYPQELKTWLREPAAVRIPEGETLIEVRTRAMDALSAIVARHEKKAVAIVSHTEVNRLVILTALGAPDNALWRVGQETCAINVLRADDDVIDVLSINDRCHVASLRNLH